MKEPIDIHTRKPIVQEPGEVKKTTARVMAQSLTPPEMAEKRGLAASHLNALFAETSQRVTRDLSRIKPESVASALAPEARADTAALIADVRGWLDRFEQALLQPGLRAV